MARAGRPVPRCDDIAAEGVGAVVTRRHRWAAGWSRAVHDRKVLTTGTAVGHWSLSVNADGLTRASSRLPTTRVGSGGPRGDERNGTNRRPLTCTEPTDGGVPPPHPRLKPKTFGGSAEPVRVRYAMVTGTGGATRLNATNPGHPRSLIGFSSAASIAASQHMFTWSARTRPASSGLSRLGLLVVMVSVRES